MDELLKRVEKALCSGDAMKKLAHVEKEIVALEQKQKKLVDLFLNESIDKSSPIYLGGKSDCMHESIIYSKRSSKRFSLGSVSSGGISARNSSA